MNDKQFEVAARELCRLRGIDPDERAIDRSNETDALWYCAAWENAKTEIIEHGRIAHSISVGYSYNEEDEGGN